MIQYKHNCKYCGAEVERVKKNGSFTCFNCAKQIEIISKVKHKKKIMNKKRKTRLQILDEKILLQTRILNRLVKRREKLYCKLDIEL